MPRQFARVEPRLQPPPTHTGLVFVPVRGVRGQTKLRKGLNPEPAGIAEDAETGTLCDLCGISATSAFKNLAERRFHLTYRPRYVLVSFVFDLNNSPEDTAARLDRQLAELARVAEVGLGLCREIAAKVKGAEALTYDPSSAFVRISRAVRLTIVLENRLIAQHQRVLEGKSPAASADRHAKAKAVILGVLNASIESELKDNPDSDHERLTEMRDSLPKVIAAHIDREDLLETAPISEVIEIISEALDIPVDWSLWQEIDGVTDSEGPQGYSQPPNTSHPAEVDPDTEPVRA